MFAGFVMSIGVVVPGVSSSVLLMLLGVYDIYLSSVSSCNIPILFPMGIGLCIGGILFLKLTKHCLEHFPSQTYYSIIGFVLGSILILYPGLSFDVTGLLSVSIFFICFVGTTCLEKK